MVPNLLRYYTVLKVQADVSSRTVIDARHRGHRVLSCPMHRQATPSMSSPRQTCTASCPPVYWPVYVLYDDGGQIGQGYGATPHH
jgi:hypothetical protein